MMEQEKLHDDDGFGDSMVSSSSPYQPTTEPVPHRRQFVGGLIVDMRFIKSPQGVLCMIEILFDIIIAICVGSIGLCDNACGAVSFMQSVCITSMITTTIIFLVWAFNLEPKLNIINWQLTETINALIFTLCYFIASCVLGSKALSSVATAAVVFGFFCVLLYAGSTWFAFQKFRLKQQKQNSGISHIEGVNDEGELDV